MRLCLSQCHCMSWRSCCIRWPAVVMHEAPRHQRIATILQQGVTCLLLPRLHSNVLVLTWETVPGGFDSCLTRVTLVVGALAAGH